MNINSGSDFYFQVLGANSAVPAADRFPSSFILGHHSRLYLLDCGEGSQIKMSQFRIKRSRIGHIFISHMHGDHVLGLPALLNSFSLNGRNDALTIFGPEGIQKFVERVMSATHSHLSFPIKYCELSGKKKISLGKIDNLEVEAFPLRHRVPTYGYRFTEVFEELNIDPEAIKKYELSIDEIINAKKGQDIIKNDKLIPNSKITLPQKVKRSFSYCSDTVFDPTIVKYIKGSHLLYHEATYLEEKKELAKDRMHSTAREAAEIAYRAAVHQLVIGHYSSRYNNLTPLLEEARSVFEATQMAEEGSKYAI